MLTTIEFKPTIQPVVDAFSGGPLVGEIAQCAKCACCYGTESQQALIEHNHGQCMSCGEPMTTAQA
jgi:hypothetical protein